MAIRLRRLGVIFLTIYLAAFLFITLDVFLGFNFLGVRHISLVLLHLQNAWVVRLINLLSPVLTDILTIPSIIATGAIHGSLAYLLGAGIERAFAGARTA